MTRQDDGVPPALVPPPPPAPWLGSAPAAAAPHAPARAPVPAADSPEQAAPETAAAGGAADYRWWSRVSLRSRLVAILLVALVVALAATGFGVQRVLSYFLVEQLDDQLASQYTKSVEDPRYLQRVILGGGGRGGGQADLPTSYAFFVYVDGESEGRLFRGTTEDEVPQFVAITSAEASELDGEPFTLQGADGAAPWRAVAVPMDFGSSGGSVTIALSMEHVDAAVAQLNLYTVLIGATVIIVCLGIGLVAIRRSLAPLTEVEETAAAIAAGDLSRRVPARPDKTEVGRLTASLNGMLTQIESAFRDREASEARTRRFAADASHELRTPLAAIRGFAELYRLGGVTDADDVARTMRRIEQEATRMGVLVEDLLLLARLDEQRPGRSEPVDLAVLAGDAVHDARGLDATRAVSLTGLGPGFGPQPAVVTGDDARLRQVVANLVANAVRHTPAGTPVEVGVGVEGAPPNRRAVLEVRDHGPGIAPDVASKVFERFYRLDASRQRGKGGGSGLGLSIVAAVVASHGGDVAVSQTPGGGATFRVTLPASGDSRA